MGLHIGWLSIDAHDVEKLARFWEQVLDAKRIYEDEDDENEVVIQTPAGWKILIYKVPDDKIIKNRLHLDLVPDDQEAEIARVKALGATDADIGQTGEESWVVLADPEGNEFCILRAGADTDG